MANARSPNYPAIGLQSAIDRAAKIHEKEHTHKAPREVMAKALGYQGLNGKSLTVLSALKKFGLLEDVGKDLKISADALIILAEPIHSLERAAAVRRAAFAPVLFDEIRKNYGEAIPSDENLRAFLLRKDFLASAVDAPIRAYRETIGLVNSLPKEENGEIPDKNEEPPMNPEPQGGKSNSPPSPKFPPANPQATGATFAFPNGKQVGSAIPVSATCSMTIIADGEVTQEGLERLIKYVELIKTWFPTANGSGLAQ